MRIRNHTNPFNYFERLQPLDLAAIFSKHPDHIDIAVGFGRGVFLRHYAQTFPDRNVLGIEVRKSPVTILEKRISEMGLKNTYLVHGNAHIVLEDGIQLPCIDRVFVFHPDPWFKKRHHKRRVINTEFLKMLIPKLNPGAKIYISTDVEPLFEAMIETFEESGKFKENKDVEFWETIYRTHWHLWSIEDERMTFSTTFELIP